MPTPQAVIFDMDGTLIDTERVSQTAWRRAAADLGLDVPERIWNAFVGCSIPNARAMIKAVQSGDAEAGERIARNLCQSYGVTPEQAIQQAKGFFHIQ